MIEPSIELFSNYKNNFMDEDFQNLLFDYPQKTAKNYPFQLGIGNNSET